MSDDKPKGIKSKLDLIWNELQTNLPSINLNNSEDDFVDDFDIDNELMIRDFNQDFNLNENVQESDDFLNDDELNGLDRASVSDVYLKETDELNIKLENFNKIKTSNLKLISNSNESAQTAAKITKNIFDNTSSNLNMDIFNAINIDELLNTIDKNNAPSGGRVSKQVSSTQTTPRIVDDQNIIKKLAEFSTKYSKDNSLNNLNLQTGAASGFEHNKNSNLETNDLKALNQLDEIITNDLKSFLKSHKIRDGNLTETRRIDLRDSQNMKPNANVRVYSKPKAEHLFAEILSEDSVYPDLKNGQKLKYINDGVTSSESEDEEEDDESDQNTLWFERYRQHRLLNSVKKN